MEVTENSVRHLQVFPGTVIWTGTLLYSFTGGSAAIIAYTPLCRRDLYGIMMITVDMVDLCIS